MLNCVVEILKDVNTMQNKGLIKGSMNESSPEEVSLELDLDGLVENS